MTTETLVHLHGMAVLMCAADGPRLRGEGDATDVVGAALSNAADLVAVPAQRLADEFFTLSTGVAGQIVQKFVNYRLRLAVVGDISHHLAGSSALRASSPRRTAATRPGSSPPRTSWTSGCGPGGNRWCGWAGSPRVLSR